MVKKTLVAVYVREISTGKVLLRFPPTRAGENRANRYIGLADLEVVKEYRGKDEWKKRN